MGSISISDLYRRGQSVLDDRYQAEETAKKGTLRAGSCGIVTEKGEVSGASCHRKSYLRYKGIRVYDTETGPVDPSSSLMMEGGKANELLWKEVLEAVGYKVKAEEEIPTSWELDGVKVTGRPDMVLLNPDSGVPECVLELKQMSSLYTVRDVAISRKPKLGHLVQIMHYMWQLNLPGKLCYVSRSVFHTGYKTGISNELPRRGQTGSEFIEYGPRGDPKKINPLLMIYDVKIDSSGRLSYRVENSGKLWTPTIITIESMKEYYRGILSMDKDNNPGPRPSVLDATGEEAGYKLCDYCELRDLCTQYESKGLKDWMKAVKKIMTK